jgi:hypothetical protein
MHDKLIQKGVKMSKQQKKEKCKSKKALFAFIALFASAAIIIGSAFAFFSDYITGSGNVTAGTLDISGTYAYKQNGTTVSPPVANFNPGDVITASVDVNNAGNKSAWLQYVLDLGTLDPGSANYIKVCAGELTYSACDGSTNPYLTLAGGKITTQDANGTIGNDIIDGTGAGAEVETSGDHATSHAAAYTIKFLDTAPNSAQGKSVNFMFTVNAMQFRNNPSPVWTAIEQI